MENAENVVAIIQAQMKNPHLPGAPMASIRGAPVLDWVITRLRMCQYLESIVIAAPDSPAEKEMIDHCVKNRYGYHCGPEEDVLLRYVEAAAKFNAQTIVRITADSPFIDPIIVDAAVAAFLAQPYSCDYVSNTIPARTFPYGLDVEVFSANALKRAHDAARTPEQRADPMLHLRRNAQHYTLQRIVCDQDWSMLRWCVGGAKDLEVLRRIAHSLEGMIFSWKEVLALVYHHWDDLTINAVKKEDES